jgi:hypothetical protein
LTEDIDHARSLTGSKASKPVGFITLLMLLAYGAGTSLPIADMFLASRPAI